ncbi:MAG: elongation factor P [Candidatus Calescibacterium sp.]|nr:elongation factor P [Candidatus Calescibacterium sp.]MCX7734673.1 elongation factor P [bacterium]MDW8087798.1 elongation factor P [Candidatus Calescibacterium sp.]
MEAGDLRVGTFVRLEGRIYEVVNFEKQKIAQRQPHVKVKLKDIVSGKVIDRTFVSSDKIEAPDISIRPAKFVYKDANQYVFLDSETYEEYRFDEKILEDKIQWFTEGVDFDVILGDEIALTVRIPKVMEFEVIETPPGVRGDTESGGIKPATLSNGMTINVPLHIKKGDKIKVNTETNEYVGRA